MDKSHNSLLRQLFIGSLNKSDIPPESNYVQTLQKRLCEACTKRCQISLSAEVGHTMEEKVLKLDTAWKKKC